MVPLPQLTLLIIRLNHLLKDSAKCDEINLRAIRWNAQVFFSLIKILSSISILDKRQCYLIYAKKNVMRSAGKFCVDLKFIVILWYLFKRHRTNENNLWLNLGRLCSIKKKTYLPIQIGINRVTNRGGWMIPSKVDFSIFLKLFCQIMKTVYKFD
jgi:hypothetical protein